MAIWGRGAIRQRHLAAEGRVWVVLSSLGIYLYDTQTMETIAQIDDVQADQISPDGQRLAVANSNRQVSIYSLIDGQKLLSLGSPSFEQKTTLPVGEAPIEGPSISGEPDNLTAEAGSQLPQAFPELPGITALRFSADGEKLAVGYNQPAILVWDLETGQIEASLAHAIMPAANRIEFSPDGRYLANNTYRNVLGLWSLVDERLIWRTANGGRLTVASFLPDGKQLLTESATSERVFVWDINSGNLDQTVQVTNLVDYLNFSQDGGSLFFLTRRPQSGRYIIEQRSLRDGKLETFAEFPTKYAVAPDQLSLAGVDENGQLQQFSLRDWQLETDLPKTDDPSTSLVFSVGGKDLAAVGWQSFKLWSYPDLALLSDTAFEQPLFSLHLSSLQGLQLTKDERLLAYGLDGGRLFVWDVFGERIARFDLATNVIGPPALAPDGRYLAICTSEGLRLFDLRSSQNNLLDRCKSPGRLLFSNDRTRLARASGLQVDLLSLPGGARVQYLAGNTLEITSLAFSTDGSYFASGTEPQRGGAESVVWNFARPLFPMRLPVPSNGVESLAFSDDNQYLATGGGDDKIRIWRVSDGWLLRVRTLLGSASRLAFSPDNQLIAVGLSSGAIQILKVPDGEPLAVLSGHSERITGLAFSEDGTALYSTSADGTIRLWGIPMPAAGR